ncbi:uncharacterized protein LOC116033276 [Ipomoea triloba]|uniref:uncharacterized protein LOC116033276 n=1 Tax=Ipomoea triloba TaxID=35885 RepID=UPI00125E02B8|nr:uncharacterized protein LOC116033276 [Ipomoea triloba]
MKSSKGTLDWMEEILDKVLATTDWCGLLPDACVSNMLTRSSDHSALFLGVKGGGQAAGGLRRSFRFKMAWVYDESCRKHVEDAWQEGRQARLLGCFQFCGDKLLRWGGDHFHKFGAKIRKLRQDQLLLKGLLDPHSLGEYQRLESELCQLEAQEDAYWRQWAKQHWLRGADANTKFFHRYASARKKKNSISRLKNESNVWVEGEGLNAVVLDYFRDILASNISTSSMDSFVASIVPRVSPEQNATPLRPFEAQEVKIVLFSMFYQHFWDVVGGDVSDFVLKCLNDCSFLVGLNDTNVVLIPKKDCLEKVFDLRPIALCNVVYKIMAKMVANRMKPLLGEVISDSQSVFILNRLITDNILIVVEVGHYLNRTQCGMVGWGALKLDMAKAYDRVEWPFLRSMLLALGFSVEWVDLVMLCVTTISYNFLVNGRNAGRVVPTRNDSLLFFKVTPQETGAVKQCLVEYEQMSGQVVNFHKSSVCFSRNTPGEVRDEVASMLGIVQAPNLSKYLGFPSFIGREKRAVFLYIEDKIKHRIGSWICLSIERVMNRYWWGPGNQRSIHWKAWDRLCVPKRYGGLGFKDLRAFNLAMLSKQAWRFLTRPHSLVARIYKARYFPKSSFIDATLGNCPSFCWRSIMSAHELICSGVRRRVGDGKSTLIWGHPWLPDENNPMIQIVMPQALNGSLVLGLIDPVNDTWDQSILRDIFSPVDVERILKVPVSPLYEDSWFWLGDPGGCYTVKQGYRRIIGDFRYRISSGSHAIWLSGTVFCRNRGQFGGRAAQAASAAWHQSRKATVGAVLLAQGGGFVAAFNGHLSACHSPLMAESLACKEVLSWLKGQGIASVHVHTDFSFVPRTANRAAHALAALAFSQDVSMYLDSLPPTLFPS